MLNFVGLSGYKQLLGNYLLLIISTWNILPKLNVLKEALYRIWCGANRLGNSGVHTLGDNSAFVNPAG